MSRNYFLNKYVYPFLKFSLALLLLIDAYQVTAQTRNDNEATFDDLKYLNSLAAVADAFNPLQASTDAHQKLETLELYLSPYTKLYDLVETAKQLQREQNTPRASEWLDRTYSSLLNEYSQDNHKKLWRFSKIVDLYHEVAIVNPFKKQAKALTDSLQTTLNRLGSLQDFVIEQSLNRFMKAIPYSARSSFDFSQSYSTSPDFSESYSGQPANFFPESMLFLNPYSARPSLDFSESYSGQPTKFYKSMLFLNPLLEETAFILDPVTFKQRSSVPIFADFSETKSGCYEFEPAFTNLLSRGSILHDMRQHLCGENLRDCSDYYKPCRITFIGCDISATDAYTKLFQAGLASTFAYQATNAMPETAYRHLVYVIPFDDTTVFSPSLYENSPLFTQQSVFHSINDFDSSSNAHQILLKSGGIEAFIKVALCITDRDSTRNKIEAANIVLLSSKDEPLLELTHLEKEHILARCPRDIRFAFMALGTANALTYENLANTTKAQLGHGLSRHFSTEYMRQIVNYVEEFHNQDYQKYYSDQNFLQSLEEDRKRVVERLASFEQEIEKLKI